MIDISMGEIALEYAAAGAEVLPLHTPTPARRGGCSCMARDCKDVGKHPRTLNGLKDATADVETVTRWWDMWPAATIGIRPRADEVVLDVDPRNGGLPALMAWQRTHGALPPTRRARTGGGGWHAWYRIPAGLELVGKLCPGVDVKSNAGYVVAPPSLHFSGRRYEWIDAGKIADAPEFLVAALTRRPMLWSSSTARSGGTPAQLAGLVRTVAAAHEGNRNHALFFACCRAAEHGFDVAPLIEAGVSNGLERRKAEATARSALRTIGGLPDREARATVASARRAVTGV